MLNCKINIDSFLWDLDESLVDSAAILVKDNLVGPPERIGQGVWVVTMREQDVSEIEFFIQGTIVKKVHCTCDAYRKGKLCQHIVAGLMAFSEQKTKKEEKKKYFSEKRTYKKHNIKDLIVALPEDRLIAFGSNFSKKNRRFALLLRCVAIPYAYHDSDKYIQLMTALLNFGVSQNTISSTGMSFLNEAFSTLFSEMKYLIEIDELSEVQHFVWGFLSEWPKILSYTVPEKSRPELMPIQAISILEKSFPDQMAPEKADELVEKLGYFVSQYLPASARIAGRLMSTLKQLADTTDRQQLAYHEFKNNLFSDLPLEQVRPILEVLLYWEWPSDELIAIGNGHWSIQEVLEYIELLHEAARWDVLPDIIELGKTKTQSKILLQKLRNFEILLAKLEGNQQAVIELAEESYRATGDSKYYKILAKEYGAKWPNQIMGWVQIFHAQKKYPVVVDILQRSQNWTKLFEYLIEYQDIKLLQKIDHQLFKKQYDETKELYYSFLATFLDKHLGEKSAYRIEDILEHLERIGYPKLSKELRKWVKKKYAHRPILNEVI